MAWPRKRFDFPIAIVLRHLQVYILNCPAALVPPKFGRSSRRRGKDFLGIQSDSVVLGKGEKVMKAHGIASSGARASLV